MRTLRFLRVSEQPPVFSVARVSVIKAKIKRDRLIMFSGREEIVGIEPFD